MTLHICINFWAKSAQELIQGRAKIGHGGPLIQIFWLQTGRLQQQTEYIAII